MALLARPGLLAVLLAAVQAGQNPPPPTSIAPPQATTPATADTEPAGAISGVVVNGATGAPVAGALVYVIPGTLSRPIRTSQTRQMTDDKGRFVFADLPADSTYTISASKFGFLDGGYGRDAAPTDPLRTIDLKGNQWASNLRVPIWVPGAISGVVRDEAGEPVVGVFVRVLKRLRILGRDDFAAGAMTVTDDRGAYRISGLAPGRYVVQVPSVQASIPAATKMPAPAGTAPDGVLDVDDTHRLVIGRYPLPPPPVNGRQMAYPVVFHPSTSTVSQASAIDLKYGDDRPNIDLTLTPGPSVRVSGVVDGPPEALASLTLRLLPAGLENLGLGSEAATALVAADGRFTFVNVPAGSYTIDAPVRVSEFSTTQPTMGSRRFPTPPPNQGFGQNSDWIDLVPGINFTNTSFRGTPAEYSGRAAITVAAADLTGVVVRLRPHATMTGRVIVDPDPAKPEAKPPARFNFTLDPAGGEAYLGRPQRAFQDQVAPDEFRISGIVPGQYHLRAQGNPGWMIKSISMRGRDYTTAPFDAAAADDLGGVVVTMTNATPELSGAVREADGLKADAAIVIAFPADPAQWRNVGLWPARLRASPVTSAGTYRFTTLPAGEYLVAAIDRGRTQTWRDPDVLAQVARYAARVTLTWGGRSSVDVPAVVVR